MKPGNIVTVLDIGSTKVCCCIANVSGNGKFTILGVGYYLCNGVKAGVIVDMESVEKSIVKAVELAEKTANFRVKSIYVNISGKNVKSKIVKSIINIGRRIVTKNDIDRLLASLDTQSEYYEIIHAIPIMFSVDSLQGIKDPIGMLATQLEATINVVTAPKAQLNNILICISKYHLKPAGVVATSYASGLYMYNNNGTRSQIIIDFGAETTSISFFYDGLFCGCETISLGGKHITNDIAYGLNISTTSAERVKTLHGAAFVSIDDVRDTILVPVMEDDNIIDLQQVSKNVLNNIIQSRAEEILNIIKKKIDESIFNKDFKRCSVTLTGGGSQLTGIKELASIILCKRVQIQTPTTVASNTHLQMENDFATTLGIIKFVQINDTNVTFFNEKISSNEKIGIFKKALLWIENNL